MGSIKLQYEGKLYEVEDYHIERFTNGSKNILIHYAIYKGKRIRSLYLDRLISRLEKLIANENKLK